MKKFIAIVLFFGLIIILIMPDSLWGIGCPEDEFFLYEGDKAIKEGFVVSYREKGIVNFHRLRKIKLERCSPEPYKLTLCKFSKFPMTHREWFKQKYGSRKPYNVLEYSDEHIQYLELQKDNALYCTNLIVSKNTIMIEERKGFYSHYNIDIKTGEIHEVSREAGTKKYRDLYGDHKK